MDSKQYKSLSLSTRKVSELFWNFMFFWFFFIFVNNCEKHISFKMWTNLFTSKNHLLTALRALSIPCWQCVIWPEQPCATAGVAVQPSQWPLWKTCYQTGRPACATLPVDWNGAEGGQRIACIPMITHVTFVLPVCYLDIKFSREVRNVIYWYFLILCSVWLRE